MIALSAGRGEGVPYVSQLLQPRKLCGSLGFDQSTVVAWESLAMAISGSSLLVESKVRSRAGIMAGTNDQLNQG